MTKLYLTTYDGSRGYIFLFGGCSERFVIIRHTDEGWVLLVSREGDSVSSIDMLHQIFIRISFRSLFGFDDCRLDLLTDDHIPCFHFLRFGKIDIDDALFDELQWISIWM